MSCSCEKCLDSKCDECLKRLEDVSWAPRNSIILEETLGSLRCASYIQPDTHIIINILIMPGLVNRCAIPAPWKAYASGLRIQSLPGWQ